MPPDLLACVRFPYKVVHKIGRLRMFNRAREIAFSFLTVLDYFYETWHTRSSCSWLPNSSLDFLLFEYGLNYGLSKLQKKKRG